MKISISLYGNFSEISGNFSKKLLGNFLENFQKFPEISSEISSVVKRSGPERSAPHSDRGAERLVAGVEHCIIIGARSVKNGALRPYQSAPVLSVILATDEE